MGLSKERRVVYRVGTEDTFVQGGTGKPKSEWVLVLGFALRPGEKDWLRTTVEVGYWWAGVAVAALLWWWLG